MSILLPFSKIEMEFDDGDATYEFYNSYGAKKITACNFLGLPRENLYDHYIIFLFIISSQGCQNILHNFLAFVISFV
jgi:hypothetical protein